MINKNRDLIEIIKLRDRNELLTKLKHFFKSNSLTLGYKQFKSLVNSQHLYNRLKLTDINYIWNRLNSIDTKLKDLRLTNEQYSISTNKRFYSKSLQEYQQKIIDMKEKGNLVLYNEDLQLDDNFINEYNETINSSKNFNNPFKPKTITYINDTNMTINAVNLLAFDQDFEMNKPNTMLVSRKQLNTLLRKAKKHSSKYLGDLYNKHHLKFLYWITDNMVNDRFFQSWKSYNENRNDIAKSLYHKYSFKHLLDFDIELSYEIVAYSQLTDKDRILDKGYYPTYTTKKFYETSKALDIGVNRKYHTNYYDNVSYNNTYKRFDYSMNRYKKYDLSCKFYRVCSKIDNINCNYCNKMIDLKKLYTKKQRRSYLLAFDYVKPFSVGIKEYIEDLEDKYPKATKISRDTHMIYLDVVKMFNLNTFKPIQTIYPKIRQSFNRSKNIQHLKESFLDFIENSYQRIDTYKRLINFNWYILHNTYEDYEQYIDNSLLLIDLSLEKERKYRERLKRQSKKNKINLFNEYVKTIAKKEIINVEYGSMNFLKINMKKDTTIQINKGFNNPIRFIGDNIVYLHKEKDKRQYNNFINRLEKKVKSYKNKIKKIKQEKTILRYMKLINYYKNKILKLKNLNFLRTIVIQEDYDTFFDIEFNRFKRFFYMFLIEHDLNKLDKELRDKIRTLYRTYRNDGYIYINDTNQESNDFYQLNSYFLDIFKNCIFNQSKILDL